MFLDGEGWGAIAGQNAKWKVQKCGSAVGDSVVFRQGAPGSFFLGLGGMVVTRSPLFVLLRLVGRGAGRGF